VAEVAPDPGADGPADLGALLAAGDIEAVQIHPLRYLVPVATPHGTLRLLVGYNNPERSFVMVRATLLDCEAGHSFAPGLLAAALNYNAATSGSKLAIDPATGTLDVNYEFPALLVSAAALRFMVFDVVGTVQVLREQLHALDRGEGGEAPAPPAEEPAPAPPETPGLRSC
jgi:hypothetical protein